MEPCNTLQFIESSEKEHIKETCWTKKKNISQMDKTIVYLSSIKKYPP